MYCNTRGAATIAFTVFGELNICTVWRIRVRFFGKIWATAVPLRAQIPEFTEWNSYSCDARLFPILCQRVVRPPTPSTMTT